VVRGLIVQDPPPLADNFMRVPVFVTHSGSSEAFQATVEASQAENRFEFSVPGRPLLLEVDPDFDVFRKLAREEFPATFGEVFAAEHITLVTPAHAGPEAGKNLNRLVAALTERFPQIRRSMDADLAALPEAGAVWLLGWENRFLPVAAAALGEEAELGDGQLRLAGNTYRRDTAAALVSARRKTKSGAQTLLWLGPTTAPPWRTSRAGLCNMALQLSGPPGR